MDDAKPDHEDARDVPAGRAGAPGGGGRARETAGVAAHPRRWWHWLIVAVGVLVVVVGAGLVWWIVGAPNADVVALEAASNLDGVSVTVTDDQVVLEATDDLVSQDATGAAAGGAMPLATDTMVFYPGARVPPEAYVATWAPVVAATGIDVVIPAMPLRLAVLDMDAADGVRAQAASQEGDWWIGGHSLGGTMAASFLADQPAGDWAGLVLWGSYPNGDVIAGRDDYAVASVFGSRDGLTTVDEVDASRADLPATAEFIELVGVNHAQFGAYGDQAGDMASEVDDATAHAAVAEATAEFLVTASPR